MLSQEILDLYKKSRLMTYRAMFGRIREKIELNPKKPEYLKVVWGIGYKMEKKA